MFRVLAILNFLSFITHTYSFAEEIPIALEHGVHSWVEVDDSILERMKLDGLSFMSLADLRQVVRNREAISSIYLGYHDDYEMEDGIKVIDAIRSRLPDGKKWKREDALFFSLGPVDSGVLQQFALAEKYSAYKVSGESNFFAIMERRDFNRILDSYRQRNFSLQSIREFMRIRIVVVPNFEAEDTTRQNVDSMITDLLLETHSPSDGRYARVFAFEGGYLEQAVLTRLMSEISYQPLKRFKGDSQVAPAKVELWSGLSAEDEAKNHLAVTSMLTEMNVFNHLPVEGKVDLSVVNALAQFPAKVDDIADQVIRVARVEKSSVKEIGYPDIPFHGFAEIRFTGAKDSVLEIKINTVEVALDTNTVKEEAFYLERVLVNGREVKGSDERSGMPLGVRQRQWRREYILKIPAPDSKEKVAQSYLNIDWVAQNGFGHRKTTKTKLQIPNPAQTLRLNAAQVRRNISSRVIGTLYRKALIVAANIVGEDYAEKLFDDQILELVDLKIFAGKYSLEIDKSKPKIEKNFQRLEKIINDLNRLRHELKQQDFRLLNPLCSRIFI